MPKTVSLTRNGEIAILIIANPPVNALALDVIIGIAQAVDDFEADRSYAALLLHCSGRTFVAGGDISTFDDPDFSSALFNRTLSSIEAMDRPVVAALHGTVLGGGLELALACHWRIAAPGTKLGFPEVKIGVLPGSMGTQKLPRIIGIELALDLISSGRSIDAWWALEKEIVDEVSQGEPLEVGLNFTSKLLAKSAKPKRISEKSVPRDGLAPDFFQLALQETQGKKRFYPAARNIVLAVQASLLPFAEGEVVEGRLFEELRTSPESKALRHIFFAERQAQRIPRLPKDMVLRPINSVGIVGAGTMGGAIAMNFTNVGIPVVLIETTKVTLDRGLGIIRSNYETSVAKGRMTALQVEERMSLTRGSLDFADLASADLVIEAVFENMELKSQIFARLGQTCKPSAIIATNTSTLDVNLLAQMTGRVTDVVGMHFFSPANVMRLLEVVRGDETSPEVLASVMQVAKKIDKVAVISGVCYGFIGNRMAEVYMRETEFLLLEGASPAQIDHAIETLGMAMGPCRMLDMAGIDVGAKTVIEYGKAGGLPPDGSYRTVVRKMFELGRFGQKSGIGYYRYEGRKPLPDHETMRIAKELSYDHGVTQRADEIGDQEIVERLIYTMINEGAKILEEGIAYRPGDIDVIWTAGYGFPDHTGGPLFMADQIGLGKVVAQLDHYANARGNPYGYWTVSPLLRSLAKNQQRITDWTVASALSPIEDIHD